MIFDKSGYSIIILLYATLLTPTNEIEWQQNNRQSDINRKNGLISIIIKINASLIIASTRLNHLIIDGRYLVRYFLSSKRDWETQKSHTNY